MRYIGWKQAGQFIGKAHVSSLHWRTLRREDPKQPLAGIKQSCFAKLLRALDFAGHSVIASLTMLPDYIAKAVPNPPSNRAPWYVNTAPTYAGIFLWVAFYQSLAVGTIDRASLGVCMLALAVAGLLSFLLYYYAPAMLGMKTGFPLYVVGSSTFGTKGGYLMPGLLMGILQVGWFAVGTFLCDQVYPQRNRQ